MASATLLVGTDDGLLVRDGGVRRELAGRAVPSLCGEGETLWAIADERTILGHGPDCWREVAALPEERATCLLPLGDGLLIGSSEAHLYRVEAGGCERVESFEAVPGRADWYTPWGAPPTARSLSRDGDGAIYANVHVGGIPKSDDEGVSWRPTLDIHADAHQVLALSGGRVLAACARGLATSEDGGDTWSIAAAGLAGTYCRAVAVGAGTLFLTASDGPRGGHAAVYRRPVDGDEPFERGGAGLPEWFSGNIDTHCLAADDATVAFGTAAGEVYASSDGGQSWEQVAAGLGRILCLALGEGSR